MSWASDAAASMSTGTHPLCQLGHAEHAFTYVGCDLRKTNHIVTDFPEITEDVRFFMPAGRQAVLDETQPGYCPERGESSRSIRLQQTWEGFDTALVVQLLKDNNNLVIDFGANLGWYTLVAGKMGNPVLSVEADEVLAAELEKAVERNQIENWNLAQGWIGEDTPALPVDGAPQIRLIKSDMEGNEPHMFRVIDGLLEAGKVDYVLFELSPMFADYGPCIERVRDLGYKLFIVPDKGYSQTLYSADPLGCVKNSPLNQPIEKLHSQVMGFFIRGDLV